MTASAKSSLENLSPTRRRTMPPFSMSWTSVRVWSAMPPR